MTMSAGIQWKCPVCGGDFHCKEHWLGWTEDGMVKPRKEPVKV